VLFCREIESVLRVPSNRRVLRAILSNPGAVHSKAEAATDNMNQTQTDVSTLHKNVNIFFIRVITTDVIPRNALSYLSLQSHAKQSLTWCTEIC